MHEDFGQATTPIGSLRSILGRYPFSVAGLRELLQNTEDAGASTQVLLLDSREHTTTSLLHQNLATTQGPALLAYNDAKFDENDWHALQYAYESSKADDYSKIGKYGVGFRSVFHVTDCPQIISGDTFAMFDPLSDFTGSVGIKRDLSFISTEHPGHLAPFQFFSEFFSPEHFEGTVIRCPLRTKSSQIASQVVSSDNISKLFQEFIEEELDISLLFLKNIQRIEIHEIHEDGVLNCLATLSVSRSPVIANNLELQTHTMTTTTTTFANRTPFQKTKTWRVFHCPFSKDEAIKLVSDGFPGDASLILKQHKLSPHVAIAFPLQPASSRNAPGRLFTFLPLPIFTGFPVHVHALFAITESRQNLRNPQEIGVVEGGDDQMLIKWNQILFKHYIPRAWKHFLEHLVQSKNYFSVFAAWPPKQEPAASGEVIYWQSLPSNLLEAATSSMSSIWPVYTTKRSAPIVEYRPLSQLITADPTLSPSILDALTSMGLSILRPPEYIYDLIKNSAQFPLLTPEAAHSALMVQVDALRLCSKEDRATVLDYLVSSRNVNNIIGLPLISTSNGEFIALFPKSAGPHSKSHTLLSKVEYEIFRACDDEAIPLQYLPPRSAAILQAQGPNILNIETLDVDRIVEYLTVYPSRIGLDLSLTRIDPGTIKWLSAFWTWMGTYEKKEDLFTKARHLYLLPSTQGLRKADKPLFRALRERPNLVQNFSSLGIPFLDRDVPDSAHHAIESQRVLKRIIDIHALLDAFPDRFPPGAEQLPLTACNAILWHLGTYAPTSCAQNGPFTQQQISRLKNLPIYPISTYPPSNTGVAVEKTNIPDDVSLRCVEGPSFLPSLPGIAFIQTNTTLPILEYIDSTAKRFSHMDILSLTVDNFSMQEDYVQAGALEFLHLNRNKVPPIIVETLRHLPFVSVKDKSRQKPIEVVDPNSKLVELYKNTPSRLVRAVTAAENRVVRSLQDLRLMRHGLTLPIVQELIDSISESSSPNAIATAQLLIALIIDSRLDCSGLIIGPQKRWLPTNQGLRGSSECRDATISTPSYLFDRVLATFDSNSLTIPPSLKHVLGWDQPLSKEVLIKQLGHVLQDENVGPTKGTFKTVFGIIKELSTRTCNLIDFKDLKIITSQRNWVPTTDNGLAKTGNAVFVAPILESGFKQIFCLDEKMREFLVRMGCTDSPTAEAVITNLNVLQTEPVSMNTINSSLNMLRSLPEEIAEAQRSQLLVPDRKGFLRPFDKVYFNDIGHHANLISSEATFIAHDLLEETLAIRLRLGRLGLKYNEYSTLYIDMGEDIVTTIRNNLKHYTEQQFATEFLANAIDAKATVFSLLVNKFHPSPEDDNVQALSEKMKMFCTTPSLVVYNNSTFSDKDFIGIRRTGIGGKDEERDTIGHFGVGVLTMFHFTELAILISNAHVLFINPCKQHLPVPDVASIMIPLNSVRKFYPGHIASINGLFGFDISSDEPYDGTIFILLLRQTRHFQNSLNAISHQTYSSAIIESDILESFRKRATNCFLFTEITDIVGLALEASGEQNILWSFKAQRRPEVQEADTGYSATEVTITSTGDAVETRWRIVTSHVAESAIPRDIFLPLSGHRVRVPAAAGLACLLRNGVTSHESQPYRFFSTLPLAIETSLPCHIMATFILSSDRRSIRLDEYGIESKFNTWLLTDILPPLYMFLIQASHEMGDNKQRWPGQHRSKEDIHSRILIDSFYSAHLKGSSRPIFQNAYNHEIMLTSQEVVLSGEEPPNIERLLSILRPEAVARPSKGIYQLMVKKSNLPVVKPHFVKSALLRAAPTIFSQFTLKVVEDCIAYMLEEDEEDTTNLQGLPLVPLENGLFGTIQSRSVVDVEHYYLWMPNKSTKTHNFPSRHFVHSTLKINVKETLLKLDMNILLLDATVIKRFIAEKFVSQYIPSTSASSPSSVPYRFEGISSQLLNWIHDFWKSWSEYSRLGLSYDDIADFPLVPTIHPGSCVTLSSCKNSLSLLVKGESEDFETIRVFLGNLDISVVRVADDCEFPAALYRMFRDEHYPELSFENVLKALRGQYPERDDLRDVVGGFDRDVHYTFANWARNDVNQPIPVEYQNIARQLPIWPSGRNDSTEPYELQPAEDIYMLPEGLALHITAPFVDVHVAEHGSLLHFYGPKLDYIQLRERIDLPEVLPAPYILSYRQFLEALLPRLPAAYAVPIPIPNDDGTIQPSNTLYAREPLFVAAFGTNSRVFIHSAFHQFEGLLYKHGLKTESQLNINMFNECANALEASQLDMEITDDEVARANVLFEAYGFSLPMSLAAQDEDQWQVLDEYSFIPRNMARRRLLPSQDASMLGLEIPSNVSALHRIVSPADLVREQFEAVAWSQRATFARQPNQRVLLAYPALGRPSVVEVIAHVRFLSTLVELSRSQRQIVIHDLEESYRFLDDNSEQSSISTIGVENLFLNVNDPNADEWVWDKAEDLVFENYDVDETIRHVRDFLLPFRRLLQTAGALQIHYPEYQTTQTLDSSDSKLLAFRSGFQRLREENLLTDVVFVANDADMIDEKRLVAHRSFLAVSHEHFSNMFGGGFGEGGPASTDNPKEIPVPDYSTECVRIVLDHIYKGENPMAEHHPTLLILEVLALSSFWRILDLFEDVQREIAIKLLKPRILRQIRECAVNTGAESLEQACISYEEKNQALMLKVHG